MIVLLYSCCDTVVYDHCCCYSRRYPCAPFCICAQTTTTSYHGSCRCSRLLCRSNCTAAKRTTAAGSARCFLAVYSLTEKSKSSERSRCTAAAAVDGPPVNPMSATMLYWQQCEIISCRMYARVVQLQHVVYIPGKSRGVPDTNRTASTPVT